MSPSSFASILGYAGTKIAREPAPYRDDDPTDSPPPVRTPASPSYPASDIDSIGSQPRSSSSSEQQRPSKYLLSPITGNSRDRDGSGSGHEHETEQAMRGGHIDGLPALDTNHQAENGLADDHSRSDASKKATFETDIIPAGFRASRPRKEPLKKSAHSGHHSQQPEPKHGSLPRDFATHGPQLTHSASLDGPAGPALAETPTALEAPDPDLDSGTDDCGLLIWQPQSTSYDGGSESFTPSASGEIPVSILPEKDPATTPSPVPSSTTNQSQAQTDATDSLPAPSWTGIDTPLEKLSPSAPPTHQKPLQAGSQSKAPLHSHMLSRIPPLRPYQAELGTVVQPIPAQAVMAGSSRRRLVTRAKSPLSRSSNTKSTSIAQQIGRGNGDDNSDLVTSDPATVEFEEEDALGGAEDEDGGWDYDETEWWGWVVLGVTWFVFVVGMGSCLGVWTWAWDVGTRPWAPPELENDPTLPIVGYYPALIILSCIMAWVWVAVAWVGMKYFRHAQIGVD